MRNLLFSDIFIQNTDSQGKADYRFGVLRFDPLETSAQTKDEVEGRLLLNVVIRQSATVFKLLAGEDETLLVGGDALFVLDLGLDVLDGIAGFNLERDGLARQGFDEDLHTTPQTKDQVEG